VADPMSFNHNNPVDMGRQLNNLRAMLDKTTNERNELKTHAADLTTDRDWARVQRRDLLEKVALLEAERDEARRQRDVAHAVLGELQSQVANLGGIIEQLRSGGSVRPAVLIAGYERVQDRIKEGLA
jgi:uncharacterized coiled-coil DUF342 family protein